MLDAIKDFLSVLPPTAWVAALCAAAAAAGLVHLPRDRLSGDSAEVQASGRIERLIRGRPGAVSLPLRVALSAAAGVALCAGLAGLRHGPGAWAWAWAVLPFVTAAGAVGLGWLEPASVRRRELRLIADTPEVLELMAACLEAGRPVRGALAAVVGAFDGPSAEDLGRVLAAVELGTAEDAAWHTLATHRQLGPAALDLARAVDSGTMVVEALRRHATAAREAQRAALQIRARAVGVRSVLPLMCCFIPAFLLLGIVPSVVSAVKAVLP